MEKYNEIEEVDIDHAEDIFEVTDIEDIEKEEDNNIEKQENKQNLIVYSDIYKDIDNLKENLNRILQNNNLDLKDNNILIADNNKIISSEISIDDILNSLKQITESIGLLEKSFSENITNIEKIRIENYTDLQETIDKLRIAVVENSDLLNSNNSDVAKMIGDLKINISNINNKFLHFANVCKQDNENIKIAFNTMIEEQESRVNILEREIRKQESLINEKSKKIEEQENTINLLQKEIEKQESLINNINDNLTKINNNFSVKLGNFVKRIW